MPESEQNNFSSKILKSLTILPKENGEETTHAAPYNRNYSVQKQTVLVTAHFLSKQLMLFALQGRDVYHQFHHDTII